MARLTPSERAQFQRISRDTSRLVRSAQLPMADYLDFLRFVVRFAPVTRSKLITGGEHWKL
jgi:hypothetical protein